MDLLRELLFEFGWVIPVLIVGSIIWSVIKGRKRAKEMRKAGASLNLREASKSDKQVLEDRIDQSRLFFEGSSWPKTVLVGDVNGVQVTLADYNFSTPVTKRKTKTTLLTIQTNSLSLPPFTLMPSGWLIDSLSSLVGYRDINFDSHPQFSKQYLLRAFDEDDQGNEFSRNEEPSSSAFKASKIKPLVRDLFIHELLDLLETNSGVSLEGRGDQFILRRFTSQRVPANELTAFVELGVKILSLYQEVARSFRSDDFDYLSPMSLIVPSGFVCLLWSIWWLSQRNENGIRRYRQSKSNLVFLFLPGLINLAAFYSLALHMYLFLDDWPDIGTEGFSDALYVHYALMTYPFVISFFFPLILFGPLWIIFYLIKPIRPGWIRWPPSDILRCIHSAYPACPIRFPLLVLGLRPQTND